VQMCLGSGRYFQCLGPRLTKRSRFRRRTNDKDEEITCMSHALLEACSASVGLSSRPPDQLQAGFSYLVIDSASQLKCGQNSNPFKYHVTQQKYT